MLQVETESVKQAVSLYCRLGFARKFDSETEQSKAKRNPSWNNVPVQRVRSVFYFIFLNYIVSKIIESIFAQN